MKIKLCTKCDKKKPMTDFHKKKASKDGRQSRCKQCNKESTQAWQKENSKRFEESWKARDELNRKNGHTKFRRAKRYGLTIEELDNLLKEAGGVCKICPREPIKWLVIDHDHVTGVVRGVLCERCNQGLGLFNDNVEWLQNAIKYLNNASLV